MQGRELQKRVKELESIGHKVAVRAPKATPWLDVATLAAAGMVGVYISYCSKSTRAEK